MNVPSNARLVLWYRSTRCLQSSCTVTVQISTWAKWQALEVCHCDIICWKDMTAKTPENQRNMSGPLVEFLSSPFRSMKNIIIYYVNADCWSKRPEQAINDTTIEEAIRSSSG